VPPVPVPVLPDVPPAAGALAAVSTVLLVVADPAPQPDSSTAEEISTSVSPLALRSPLSSEVAVVTFLTPLHGNRRRRTLHEARLVGPPKHTCGLVHTLMGP